MSGTHEDMALAGVAYEGHASMTRSESSITIPHLSLGAHTLQCNRGYGASAGLDLRMREASFVYVGWPPTYSSFEHG